MTTPGSPQLLVGQQVNLVHGLRQDVSKPFWTLQKPGARLPTQDFPGTPARIPTISDNDAPAPTARAAPGTPGPITTSLVLCSTWSDLLQEYFSAYSIPACCCSKDVRNAAAFAMQPGKEAAVHKAVAEHLGIPLQYANDGAYTGFALVRMTKRTAKATWDPQAPGVDDAKAQLITALNTLPAQTDPTQDMDAAPYLDFFQAHGTHYVSEVQLGDVAMQAFVFNRDVLDAIKAESPQYTGGRVTDATTIGIFRAYTQVAKFGNGFTVVATPVVTASRSTAFSRSIAPSLKDSTYKLDASIFTLYTSTTLQASFKQLPDEVPIGVKLTDITTFMNQADAGKAGVASPFCNLLDAAVLQKFGLGATHVAKREVLIGKQPDWGAMYKTTVPELVTTAATATVAISQMYFRLDGIHKQRLLYAGDTQQVQVFADVIEVGNGLELPGEVVTLISRLLLAAPGAADKDGKYPVVVLSSAEAFKNFKPVAQKMLGTMAVEGPAGSRLRRTLFNGISLVNQPGAESDAPVDVVLEATISNTYLEADQLANYNVQLGIQTTLLVAENVLNYRFNEDLANAALQYAAWLKTSLSKLASVESASSLQLEAGVQMDLAKAYTRAALLVAAPVDGRNTLAVPRLTYKEYQTAIERMTESAQSYADSLAQSSVQISLNKAQEATSELAKSLNKNVQAIGQFLLKQNEVQTDKERDVANYNASVMEKQQKSIDECVKKGGTLQEKMKAQIVAMDEAKKDMMAGLERAQRMATMEAVMGAVGAVAGLAGGLAGFIGTDFSKIGEAFQLVAKVEKLMKIVEAVAKAFTSVNAPVMNLIKINESLATTYTTYKAEDTPTDLDWNNFDADISAVSGPIGALVPETYKWVAETKKMSNLGRAITANASTLVKLQYDMMLQGWQKEIADKQVTRMQWLQTQLRQPDLPKQKAMEINLFELGTLLEARANRTTLTLLRTLALQDAALQYAFFQEPARIDKAASLNIHDVHDLLVSQATNTLTALSGLPAPSDLPRPISFVLPTVSVPALLADRKYSLTIPTNNPSIPSYYKRVRINYVEVKFTNNKPTTASGELVTVLDSSYEFTDRAPDNTTKSYRAVTPGSYTYAYDLTTGATTFSNQPTADFRDRFMTMTPFTTWALSLPATPQNDGLTFPPGTLTTEVTINFYCNAIYSTAAPPVPRTLTLSGPMATARALPAARNVRSRDVSTPTSGFSAAFDTSVQYDNWQKDPADTGTMYNVKVELGPLVPKFVISSDKTTVTVTCMIAVGRLHPTAGGTDLVLPQGYFQLQGIFDCIPDGLGGWGFQYNSPSGTKISVTQANDGWKTLKEGTSQKLKFPDQDLVESTRDLVEKAVANYYQSVRAGVRVRVLSAPEDALSIMTDRSVMRGWDVICAMDADKISALLEEKWKREQDAWKQDPTTHDADYLSTVFQINTPKQLLASVPDPDSDDGATYDIFIEMEALLGPPLISFVSNQPGECSFRMLILEGKTVTTNSKNDKRVEKPVAVGAAAVTGIVNLSVLQGLVQNNADGTYGVYIELDKSAFSTIADIPNLQNAALSLAIKSFFTDKLINKKIFLGAASTRAYSIPSLTPTRFYMTTVRPDLAGPGVLLMFITTNGLDGTDRAVDTLHNPLPTLEGRSYSAALYINTRILFRDMLLDQVRWGLTKDGVGDWCDVVREPDNVAGACRIQGRKDFTLKIGHLKCVNFPEPLDTDSSEADVYLPFRDIRIRGHGPHVETLFDFDFNVDVPYCHFTCSTDNQTFHLNVPFHPLAPTVDPSSQVVSMGSWAKSGDTQISGPGMSWYDSLTGKADLVGAVQSWFAGRFKGVSVRLPDVSVFAVSNLLFPNDQILDLKKVYAPGDLLIVGDVKDHLTTSNLVAAAVPMEPAPVMVSAEETVPVTLPMEASLLAAAMPAYANPYSDEVANLASVILPTIVGATPDTTPSKLVTTTDHTATPPTAAINPVPLLSELSGRPLIDPWTLALALPISHINRLLSSQPSAFPSTLTPAPIDVNGGAVDIRTALTLTFGAPTMQILRNDPSRVQLTVPITGGSVTQTAVLDGETLPGKTVPVQPGATLTLAARVADRFSGGSYTVAVDLATAEITALALGTNIVSDLISVGLQDNLAVVLQETAGRVPLATLPLPSPVSSDLPDLDQFTFALVSRGKEDDGSGALVLAAGSSAQMGARKPPVGVAGLGGLPLAAGSSACMYVAHSVLMESLLLPAVRQAGATATAASLLSAAALQKAPSPILLSTITGGPTEVPLYKVVDHPDAAATDVDITVPLSGFRVAVNGKSTVPGDSLAVTWQQPWTQKVTYKALKELTTFDVDLPFRLTATAMNDGAPLQLVRRADGTSELQFPPGKLGAANVDFTLAAGSVYYTAKQAAASHVAAQVKEVLTGLMLPGFSAGGAALALADHVLGAAVGAGGMKSVQAFVPGDLVLVAP